MSDTDNELMRVEEVQKLLGLGRSTIYALTANGTLPTPIKIGRSVRWRKRDLLRWLDQQGQGETRGDAA